MSLVAVTAGDAAAAPAVDAAERKVWITGSGRCGECHEKMFDEWETSAHAQSVSSPLYKTAVASAKDATCERCHAPLAQVAPRDIVVTEGVTCDVCHTMREIKPSVDGGSWQLAVDDMVKYGPRCDLKDHYFHRMGCSPEHKEAELCGSCHWWEPKGVPVFTEYADWKAGWAAKEGYPCQSCHMPKDKAALATGSPVRTGVPHHGLLGKAKDLRATALALEMKLDAQGALAVTLTNKLAGHAVPAGLPERRIVVRARLEDGSGTETWHDERALGRTLVDANNAEVPFWKAVRVASDTRIAPRGSQSMTFTVPMAQAGSVEVDVVYRGLSDAIAKQLGVTDVEEQPMTKASIKLGGGYPKTAKSGKK
ncbi:MAG: hypothetical protein HOV81_32130 [Kofleriaceae bacterium]|nr:hypothetical protein [Kofleriaceae bacterium]